MNKKKKLNIINIYTLIIFFIILFLTIGFSSFQSSMEINSLTAIVRIERDIRVTNVTLSSASNGGVSNYEEFDVNTISSSLYLPNSNSTVSFNVTIKNIGNEAMGLDNILGLPSNLSYTLSGIGIGDPLCDDNNSNICKLGSTSTLHITIGYKQGESVVNTNIPLTLEFKFFSLDKVAKIGNVYYDTLQEAIDSVPTNNTETTIVLLKNTSEVITVNKNKNIVLDIGNNTISNDGNNPVFNNYGTVKISNGTITTNASTNGAFNNQSTGKLYMSGGNIIVTGGRQAIYNNKGTVSITGGYFSSGATERATVHNLSGGTMTITGGTIISTGQSAVLNAGVMTIGVKDGNINTSAPLMQGVIYGVNATANYNFYDGIMKGKTGAFNSNNYINDIETNYQIARSEEIINGQNYKVAFLGITKTVTFNPNLGSVSETTRSVLIGSSIGTLPVPSRPGYEFVGWFDDPDNGSEVFDSTLVNDDITVFAHWTKVSIARINNTTYDTLAAAIAAVPNDGTITTVVLLHDTSEAITIASGKNIVLDLQNYTLSNNGTNRVIVNNGTLRIISGTIRTSADYAAIDNESTGILYVTGGNIISNGTRQCIYNNGIVEISGGYLSSTASGKPNNSNMERATVQNLSTGTLTITGGTLIGINQQAITNEGLVTIGIKDASINSSSPEIRGATNGIKTVGTFNFYDGTIKGKDQTVINGTVNDIENNSQEISGTEIIDGITYYTVHLN